jgi:gamma-tubulin complex component 3
VNNAYLETCKKISNKGNLEIDLTEDEILRDLLFCFNGVSGNHIQYDAKIDAFALKNNTPVSEQVRSLVNQLAEIAWLHFKIQNFLNVPLQSMAAQALQLAVKEELLEYQKLIAVLDYKRKDETAPLTLRQLVVWTMDPMERLKWLCIIIDSVKNLSGG